MNFTAELSTDPDDDGRRAARAEVVLGAGLRQRGAHAVTVQVLDLSITGFRAATHLELMNGTDIWLKLPGLEAPLPGRLDEGPSARLRLRPPLHPAVLDMIVRNAPALRLDARLDADSRSAERENGAGARGRVFRRPAPRAAPKTGVELIVAAIADPPRIACPFGRQEWPCGRSRAVLTRGPDGGTDRPGMAGRVVLPVRIELTTSALPRMRSTTELRQHRLSGEAALWPRRAAKPVKAGLARRGGGCANVKVSHGEARTRNGRNGWPRRCARI